MELTHEIEGDTLVITLNGKSLDATIASKVRTEIRELVQKSNEGKVVLDLAAIYFMDSSGFGSLITILKSITELDKELFLTNLSSQVESTFNILNLDKLFQIVPSKESVTE